MTTATTAPEKTAATVVTKPVAAPKAPAVEAPAAKAAPAPKAKAKTKTAPKAAAKPKPAVKAAAKAPAKTAAAKPAKVKKPKMVRDSFTFPKAEYTVLDELKLRAAKLGHPIKKTELLRAGIKAIAAMQDAALIAALKSVPSLKTGRPAKGE